MYCIALLCDLLWYLIWCWIYYRSKHCLKSALYIIDHGKHFDLWVRVDIEWVEYVQTLTARDYNNQDVFVLSSWKFKVPYSCFLTSWVCCCHKTLPDHWMSTFSIKRKKCYSEFYVPSVNITRIKRIILSTFLIYATDKPDKTGYNSLTWLCTWRRIYASLNCVSIRRLIGAKPLHDPYILGETALKSVCS